MDHVLIQGFVLHPSLLMEDTTLVQKEATPISLDTVEGSLRVQRLGSEAMRIHIMEDPSFRSDCRVNCQL